MTRSVTSSNPSSSTVSISMKTKKEETKPDFTKHRTEEELLAKEINDISIETLEQADSKEESEGKKKKKKKKEKGKSVPIYKLFRFATPLELLGVTIAAILSAASGALQPASIVILGQFIGAISIAMATGNYDGLEENSRPLVLAFVYMATGVLVSSYVSHCLWILTGEYQVRRIRKLYVHAILRQEMTWFDKAEEGSLTTRLVTDTQLIQDGISEKMGNFIMSAGQFVAGFIIAFVSGWRLSVVMLASLPVLMGVGAAMGHFITKYTLKAQDSYADAGSVAEQVFSGIRTVYAFSLQNRFAKLYEARLIKAMNTGIKRGFVTGFGFGSFMFTIMCVYGLAFWYGAKLNREGLMDAQGIIIAFNAVIMGAMAFLELPPNLSAVSSACGAAYKIFGVIDQVPTIDTDNADGLKPETISGEIEFKNVKFSYPTRPDITILKRLDLKIKPGMTVAFVGPSGSGKSTSIQLIQRFYDPLSGIVLLDGKDLKEYNVTWLRNKIGVVSQEPVLFNLTIKENILMGVEDTVSDQEIIAACKKANCHSFISQLPEGYNTSVGEHGGMLSGGQKQRIAIARAILKNPTILLLDEATSALDTQSERLVQAALDAASADRTTIVIAHRLSTIRNADLIAVMQSGDIVEQGTHNDLLALNGVYADLVKKQEIATENSEENDKQLASEELLYREQQQIIKEKEETTDEKDANTINLFKTSSRISIDIQEPKDKKEKSKRPKNVRAPIGKVLRQMRPEWHFIAIGTAGAALAGTCFPLFALIFGRVINILVIPNPEPPGPMEGANLYAFIFCVIGVGTLIGFTLQVSSFEIAGERYTRRLRSSIFHAFMRQEIGYFDEKDNSLGALTAKLAIDSKNVNELITKTWGDIAHIISTAITGLTISFYHSWKLTLIILTVAPFIGAAGYYQSKIDEGFVDQSKAANEQTGQVAAEAVKEIRTVAGLNKQKYFEDKYYRATGYPHKLAKRKAYLSSIGHALGRAIARYANAVGFYAGIQLILYHGLRFENMYVCIIAILITAEGIGRGTTFIPTFAKAKYSAIDAFKVLERQPSIDPDLEGIEPSRDAIRGDVDFNSISFRYPARPDVDIFSGDFNLHGKAGQNIALVGPSGCGKSTTIGMLQRWYDCLSGSVQFDGTNVKKYTLGNLRSHQALVSQEPTLFDMTISENIRFGIEEDKEVTQADIEEASKSANIHRFISSLPKGYDTRVGDKGSQLSGGQKQRIAIARALIRKPKILLLDEATSALDSESEKLVQTAIDNVIEEGGRTTITIAHRLSTIQNADLICVIKNGKVIEQGTHWELLRLNGTYKELVDQQSLNAS
ncbi:Multidrug resistance protein 2 [Choanephora cucurbitarum]|uniref:Multidrug resistance protein 2 n=1 Tax=Choanephora cucurbitarum TaxID=101091 RepID=A0A1C7NCK0_9FUNG|nr:Multidrug resistance protein 2 [Choanephora cucurbitarum]